MGLLGISSDGLTDPSTFALTYLNSFAKETKLGKFCMLIKGNLGKFVKTQMALPRQILIIAFCS